MTAIAYPARAESILRPFAIMALSAFLVGFIGVMAATGVAVLGQLGQLPGQTTRAEAAEVVASPAHSGAASGHWNFPKAI